MVRNKRKEIETAAKFVLQQSKIKLVPNRQGDARIYINVNPMPIEAVASCAYSVEVDVNTTVKIEATGNMAFGASIWRSGMIVLRSRAKVAAGVEEHIERIIKELVVD